MGCTTSSSPSSVDQNRPFHTMNPNRSGPGGSDLFRVESIQRYDEQICETLYRELQEHPELFVLNNMFMSIQFFDNYQKEIKNFQHTTASTMEKQLNRKLLKDETMECTNPDIIFEKVKENVRYRPLHGRNKNVSEPITAKRIYVINDSIEVVSSTEFPTYTSIDKPSYLVRIEETGHKGFVRLRHMETTMGVTPMEDAELVYEPTPGPSTISSDSETYSYTTITEMKTPKPIQKSEAPFTADSLPENCFTQRKIRRKLSESYDSDDSESIAHSEEDFFQHVKYINSKGFMKYFQNSLFPNSLGRALGYNETEISSAKAIRGKLFCNESDGMGNNVPCEIIPSVAIPWPVEQTYEFFMREERLTYTHEKTGMRFTWPTEEMMRDIKGMSCCVVPKGYVRKRGVYPDTDIEWEVHFPKAERYIEARMTHPQMKCFLFLLALHKTYIEPKTGNHGLLSHHIRNHMYWECEAQYKSWPEHRLGTKIIRVIKNLQDRLSKGVLPSYFIKQKNLLQDIPSRYLEVAHKTLHDILQSPTMYFIGSLRCLRYTSGKFYAPLNFKDLYNILISSDMSLVKPSATTNKRKKKNIDREREYERYVEEKNKQKFIKQNEGKKNGSKPVKRNYENLNGDNEERKDSVDSIDLEWICEKNFDMIKTKELIVLFVRNFLEIQKRSLKIYANEQTRFYLKQAWYLTRILERTAAAFQTEATDLQRMILQEEETLKKRVAAIDNSEIPPNTPIRNSILSQHFDINISQQLRNNVVNLNNLHNVFNNGMPHSSALKHKKSDANKHINSPAPRKSVAFVNV